MKVHLLVCAAALVCLVGLCEASETSKRCTWSLLKATKACKVSCKFLGHTTGVCTPEDFCLCSGEDYEFLSQVEDWAKEHLSISQIGDKLKETYQKVKKEIGDFSWMKDITVSRCQLGKEFCRRACHSVGSVDGECNADHTDCECTEKKVSFEQFRKCASASVCRVYCQAKGSRHGECTGETGWDCVCSGKKVKEEEDTTTESAIDIDVRNTDYDFNA